MPRITLNNIAAEKRERVLREAALCFAERGYAQADMAALAKRCGVAKGSLYNYFENKEELYLYVCRDGLERSRSAVWGSAPPDATIFELVDHIFSRGVDFARLYPEYISLYLHSALGPQERFASRLSLEVEKQTADRLKEKIRAGIAAGIVRHNLDVAHAALLINNTYVMFLAALVSEHFKIRMREYLEFGELAEKTIDAQKQRAVQLLQEFLRP